MSSLDSRWFSLRSVEIQRCFASNPNANLAFLDIPQIMRIGQITRLANMLRRREIISYEAMKALGALLGMQPDTLDSNLIIMQALTWVDVKKDAQGNIISVTESIPRLEKVLETLGELYTRSTKPEIPNIRPVTELENASVEALDMCAKKPCTIEAIKSELKLNETIYNKISQLGNAGKYLEMIELSDKKQALWSPVYYYNKYDTMKKFFQRQTITSLVPIGETIELCAENVGLPLEKLKGEQLTAAKAGVKYGAILPITLWMPSEEKDSQNSYTFLFPPLKTFQDSDPVGDFYEKSKVLLASIRFGEHYAPRSKIKNPIQVISKLKRDGKLGNPHSFAFEQYRIPASRGLVLLKEEEGTVYWYGTKYKGWTPYLIKSDENMQALEIVESLLTPSKERVSATLTEDVNTASTVLSQTLSCFETLEFRGAKFPDKISVDPDLERSAQRLALTLHGGAYE